MKNRHPETGVFPAVRTAVRTHRILSVGTVLCVAASIVSSLLPPLLLARVIDSLTAGLPLSFTAALLYFGSLALERVLSSAQETLLVLFGQKMTHALRSEMSRKLTRLPAGTLAAQNPGEVAARFSGDVDTVEALFTSGIISMIADACRILSILAVIAVKNTGLALILLPVLPILTVFTRFVQKRMLSAQLENRRAVAAVSGQVPETLHNIRTIHALGLEEYMAKRYDRRIGESYTAVEKTNFYDALYSPVVLLLNAAVVGAVMLLSASGKPEILALFGMSVGTSVAVINYISRIFSPIESLGMEIQTIQSAMAGVKRIDAFLSQAERTLPEERATAARGDIVLSHVTFGYKSRPVLRDFSMTVKEGEQVTLIGRTGAGKSTVAAELERQLHIPRAEMDALIVEREGMAISDIFAEKGETYFRDAETALLKDLTEKKGIIISCGGGAVMRDENAALMKQCGKIVLLTATPETIYERVKDSTDRPILNGNMNVDYIRELMEKRKDRYLAVADVVVATDQKSAEEITREILAAFA